MRESLSASLEKLLHQPGGEPVTLAALFDRVGDKGFGLLLMVLSLPSALPIPAPGYSTPFGVLLAGLGIQMIMGRRVPWLPQWAAQRKLSRSLTQKMAGAAVTFFSKVEHLIKPRMAWIAGPLGLPVMGILVLVMAGLMILPIPFTNTAPAMVVFLIGVGLTEEDGVFAGAASVLGTFAVFLYLYVVYLVLTVGVEGAMALKDRLLGG